MSLPSGKKLELLTHMDAVWSEEVLREHGGELTAKSVYDLTMRATGNRDAAERAYARRFLAIEEEKQERQRRR